jgi:hypothetical protein
MPPVTPNHASPHNNSDRLENDLSRVQEDGGEYLKFPWQEMQCFRRKTSALWNFILKPGLFNSPNSPYSMSDAPQFYAEAQCPPSTRKSAPVMKDEPSASK